MNLKVDRGRRTCYRITAKRGGSHVIKTLAASEATPAGHSSAAAAAAAESNLTNVDGVVLRRLCARSRNSGFLILSDDLADLFVAEDIVDVTQTGHGWLSRRCPQRNYIGELKMLS